MDLYGGVTALLIHLHVDGERAKGSFLSSIPLFLLYRFVFPPVIISGQKKRVKCVLEILRNCICRNGNPHGISI